ncbi:copper resistance protein CopC [Arthrobacter sp. zg-Y820]|uniref:copper resistance CopC family protein n=1 Tax=unclassified Arthrobacter TaxID=235627 RepID=UPI001E4AFB52|nr:MULTISPECIES: copper resistance CopC family protein [unclassified Arthrobacter]MCC9195632.1 copper resistance protein CopC [Arthrobacter sp. zg-Y820]MDK1278491.1 copper resistance protein CopC [Arthrobacter sp. zg.Y820]WIB09073.1 copper resistance protein CopC [Arthrobacter sp. zg-Y820]
MSSYHPLNPFQSLSPQTRGSSGSLHPVMVRALVLAALLFAGLSAVLASAPPAHAHDELVGTVPAAGERLDAAPAELELAFSSPLMDLGNQILVLDADGRNWAESAPVLTRETLVQPLPANMPNGEYSVRWRAVSSDGHPITGSYEFLVGADAVAGSAATALRAESGAAAPDDGASDGASEGAETAETADSTEASDDGGLPAWLVPGILGGVTGLVILAVYSVVSRRRARNGNE